MAKGKIQMIDKACALMNEAKEKITEAKRLFEECGIIFCGGFDNEPLQEFPYEANMQIYEGIKKLEEITGVKAYMKEDVHNGEVNTGYLYIDYNGLSFMQVGDEDKSQKAKFTFK